MLKKITTALLSLIFALLSAGEREELLKTFARENAAAENTFQSAMTTIDLTAAAGNCWQVAESQLYRALDYKLRHTNDAAARRQILKEFHQLSRDVQQIYDTPRQYMGSLAGMQIYHSIAMAMQQQIEVLMLTPDQEKRWQKIAYATLILDGKKIALQYGKADFNTVLYNEKLTLQVQIFPKNIFTYQNRDLVIFRTDLPFSGNDDFSSVYLGELKSGQLHIHTKCKNPFFTRWELAKNSVIIYYEAEKEVIAL